MMKMHDKVRKAKEEGRRESEKKVKTHIIGNFFVSDSGCGLDYVYLHYNKGFKT